MTDSSHTGYDDFLNAVEADEGYYYFCSNGHGMLPPRRTCPHCGDRILEKRSLPQTGEVITYTTVAVPTPDFEADAPYVVAIAAFDEVRITGFVQGNIDVGQNVTISVDSTETTEQRITFRPK